MPGVTDPEHKVDYRMYIGIIVFRWQVIAICLLYAMLVGVVYIQLATKIYQTRCLLLIHSDKTLQVSRTSIRPPGLSHVYLLRSPKLRGRVADRLLDKWGEIMGGKHNMMLPVEVHGGRQLAGTLAISVKCAHPSYGTDFLAELIKEHESEADSLQRTASSAAIRALEDELARIDEQVNDAAKELTRLQRIYDVARESEQAESERSYLSMLVNRRRSLMTELYMMESQNPQLKGANAAVLNAVRRNQVVTGEIEVPIGMSGGEGTQPGTANVLPLPDLPDEFTVKDDESTDLKGWHELRVRLDRLKQREKELLVSLKPAHPSVKAVQKEIETILTRLEDAQKIAEGKLSDRHTALTIALNAVESAIYRWRARTSVTSEHRAEIKRQSAKVARYESNYGTLFARLHDLRASEELKVQHFRLIEPVYTGGTPVWPNVSKILLMCLAVGLGAGFGLALTAHALDNKIQTIDDVEKTLGVPFLGGIPYWVYSGLERTIRPIVTEEHSTGAVEAYRALRTTVLTALEKENEKVVIVTSADSKEGKTLTTLNLAIMISQMGKKVLLVDMDLRRGRLHRSLGIEREPGMTDVLSRDVPIKNIIVNTRFDNLNAIASGPSVENTAERLQATDLVAVFDEIRDDYDYIIIDSSPILRVTDAVIVAGQGLGVVIYVARVNKTPKPLIRYSLDMLTEARVLGMIMNSIEMHRISSLYYAYQYPNYAYYSNAYAYGYDYYYYGDRHKGKFFRRSSWKRRRDTFAEWMRRTFLPMD